MAFSFLTPWFWFAAVALAAPIWLHLRRKHEQRLVRFSAVRFLQDQPRARASPWRVRHWLLLALRALGLLFIIAAFAWPYLRQPGAAIIKESVVYILDNTLSHQANNGFNRDRERLLAELSRAGPDVQVAVIELATAPRVLTGFAEPRPAACLKVRRLTPSFERGSYLAAFREANTLLAAAAGRHKRIVLLADNQANQWNEEASTPPFLHDVQIDLPPKAPRQQPNLWLAEPRVRRVFLANKSTANFSVRLGHLGPARSARVILRVNEQTVLDRAVDLADQPESILLQARCDLEPGVWVRAEGSVQGQPDALPGDNRVFASAPPVAEGKVALLARSPFLRLALSPEIMRGQWSTRELNESNLSSEFTPDHKADVLCIESGFLENPQARALLKRYLANAGGALLVVNRLSPIIDGCLRELGFEPEGMIDSPQPERFQFVLSNHPIFHPFQAPDFGNLMKVEVRRHARLRPLAGRALVFSQTGDGLFFEGANERGKLFVCAFGLDRNESTWPIDPSFIPFLDLALQSARTQDLTPLMFKPAETAVVRVPSGRAAAEALLSQGKRVVTRAAVRQGGAHILLPGTPGFYELSFNDRESVEEVFSVNPDPKESQLKFAETPDALTSWRVVGQDRERPAVWGSGDEEVGVSGILQQRLWWWMLLGGLFALGLETAWIQAKGEAG